MLSAKDFNLSADFDQLDDRIYHFDEMIYHVEILKDSLKEAECSLSHFLTHLKELRGISYASK